MKKEVVLVLVPLNYETLEPGMLMAYKRKKMQPDKCDYSSFYLTEDDIYMHPKILKNWIPVEPYLVSEDNSEQVEEEDLFIFSINGKLCAGSFDDLLGPDIDWVKKVIAHPYQIGKIHPELIKKIIKNGEKYGQCEIDMVDKKYTPDHNGECLNCDEPFAYCKCRPEPKLLDGNVVISI